MDLFKSRFISNSSFFMIAWVFATSTIHSSILVRLLRHIYITLAYLYLSHFKLTQQYQLTALSLLAFRICNRTQLSCNADKEDFQNHHSVFSAFGILSEVLFNILKEFGMRDNLRKRLRKKSSRVSRVTMNMRNALDEALDARSPLVKVLSVSTSFFFGFIVRFFIARWKHCCKQSERAVDGTDNER